jgi:hypothetical protein
VTEPVVEFIWHDSPVPAGLPVTQVYGWLLCPVTGRVLIQEQDDGSHSLPGGSPEAYDAARAGRRWGLPVDNPAPDGYED